MTKQKVFLVRAELGRTGVLKECVMRLPVDRYSGITAKGHKLIGSRFFDGTTQTAGRMQYALCLEAYSNGADLIKVLGDYQKNKI